MAFTAYGFQSSSAPSKGPYYSSGDVANITATSPAAGVSVFGFVDGSGHASLFYSSQSTTAPYGQVALPLLVAPGAVPPGFVALVSGLTTSPIYQLTQTDPTTGSALGYGGWMFEVQFTAGSPDAGTPNRQFFLDPDGVLLVASQPYEFA